MKKEKKKVSANELQDAECQFISLVPKGANRIPFRLMKQDGEMSIDIKSIFKQDVESFVSSVIVNKTEDLDIDDVKARIEKAGLSTEDQEEADGCIFFKQKDAEGLENQYVIKTGDNTAVHVVLSKGFNPTDFETYSFKEMFAKGGVLPNIFMAHDLLKETIMNILFSSEMETSEMAAKKVRKAINEFSDIVGGMVENIPVSAFKMADLESTKKENTVNKALQMNIDKALLEKQEADKEEIKKSEDVESENAKEEEKKSEDSENKSEDGESEKKEEQADQDSEGDIKKEEEPSDIQSVLKAIEGLTKNVEDFKKSSEDSVSDIKNTVSDLQKEVQEVSKIAKSADEAVAGFVNVESGADREALKKEPVKKQADPLVDSGYRRRQRGA